MASPEAEAARRLREGRPPNEIPGSRSRSLWAIAWEVVREPMFLMLVAAGALYLSMGDLTDALMLLAFVFFVMAITIVQERRTERALEALRDLSSPRALVLRDGVRKRIAGRDVVRGDIIFLSEGDRVPADGVLRDAQNLAADESLLTGESVPVRKLANRAQITIDRPGGDDLASVFSPAVSSQAVKGVAEVVATGEATGLGRIGKQTAVDRDCAHRRCNGRPANWSVRWPSSVSRQAPSWVVLYGVDTRRFGVGLERRRAGRDRDGDGNAARGIAGDLDRLPCPRGMANLP